MYTLEVLNPVAQNQADRETSAPAPRPTTLDGVVVGLVWNKKRGGLEALARAGELIRARYRGVTLRTYEGSQPCRPEVLKQALQECDVFVGSTGD
jgi:hypothetical protein